MGTGREAVSNKKATRESSEEQMEWSRLAVAGIGSSKDHVMVPLGMEPNALLGVVAMSEKLKGVEEDFHESGKVNRETGKVEEKATLFCEMSSGSKNTQIAVGRFQDSNGRAQFCLRVGAKFNKVPKLHSRAIQIHI